MKAPNKIYIDEMRITDLGLLNDAIVPDDRVEEKDIEYIRKDALLEWLGEQLTASYNSLDIRSNLAYSRVVDKINSL